VLRELIQQTRLKLLKELKTLKLDNMAGCYGSSSEDRYFERMLDQYTDEMYDDYEEEEEEEQEEE